jgi:hypothetical protein
LAEYSNHTNVKDVWKSSYRKNLLYFYHFEICDEDSVCSELERDMK